MVHLKFSKTYDEKRDACSFPSRFTASRLLQGKGEMGGWKNGTDE